VLFSTMKAGASLLGVSTKSGGKSRVSGTWASHVSIMASFATGWIAACVTALRDVCAEARFEEG
jgi:hypothetical protein